MNESRSIWALTYRSSSVRIFLSFILSLRISVLIPEHNADFIFQIFIEHRVNLLIFAQDKV